MVRQRAMSGARSPIRSWLRSPDAAQKLRDQLPRRCGGSALCPSNTERGYALRAFRSASGIASRDHRRARPAGAAERPRPRTRTTAGVVRPEPAMRLRPGAADPLPRSAAAGPAGSPDRLADLRKAQLRVRLLQGGDHGLQVSVQHLIKVVGLETDAMVGNPVLREVVGPDAFRAIDRPDLAATSHGGGAGGLLLGCGGQPSPEHPHRLLPVLQL